MSRIDPLAPRALAFGALVASLVAAPELHAATSCERKVAAVRDAQGNDAKVAAAERLVRAAGVMSGTRRKACDGHVEPLLRGLVVRGAKAGASRSTLALCELWLTLYRRDARATKMRLTRAAMLYKLARWRDAALAYGALAGLAGHARRQRAKAPQDRKVALRRAVLAWQKLHPSKKVRRPAGKPRPIADRKPMFAAFDAFIAATRGKADAAAVLFRKARVLYEHDHLLASVKVFARLVKRHPRHALTGAAAKLLLAALGARGKEQGQARWSAKLAQSEAGKAPALARTLRALRTQQAFRRGTRASKRRRWRQCAAAFAEVAQRATKGSKLLPLALYNGALCERSGKRLARAEALWRRLVSELPNHALTQNARFALAARRHQAKRHGEAATLYIAYAKRAAKNDAQAAHGLLYAITVHVRRREKAAVAALLKLMREVVPGRKADIREARRLQLKL
jgi:TolA-binding protein